MTFADLRHRPGLDPKLESKAAELLQAIAEQQLVLHYQPKISLATGELLGVEALVRWQHPERGLLAPDDFVLLAEKTGVITVLTEFVLRACVEQYEAWTTAGLDIPVSVNLSAGSLVDHTFPDHLEALCDLHGMRPCALELEVTESAFMEDPDCAVAVLQRLVEIGFPVTMDDFGIGFSSLAYLRNLPVSTVKIDKLFVLDLPESLPDAQIVRGAIELIHGLGKSVVAEGVETKAALDFLLLLGCDTGQGYHWSRPLPPAELVVWLDGLSKQDIEPRERAAAANRPANEAERLLAMRGYQILDTAYEAIFRDIAQAAARISGTPMSAISLIDSDRQWFKAQVGLDLRQTHRDLAFCASTIIEPDRVVMVEDVMTGARAANPLVTGAPSIRFYAGAPIVSPAGDAVGSVCVIDAETRTLSGSQLEALRSLGEQFIAVLEVRRQLLALTGACTDTARSAM